MGFHDGDARHFLKRERKLEVVRLRLSILRFEKNYHSAYGIISGLLYLIPLTLSVGLPTNLRPPKQRSGRNGALVPRRSRRQLATLTSSKLQLLSSEGVSDHGDLRVDG